VQVPVQVPSVHSKEFTLQEEIASVATPPWELDVFSACVSQARQGKFMCRAQFVYKVIQSALQNKKMH
ncbi:hypothetical protein P7M34_25000, partial [Vibrio parahaemolyticus]|nr:hypothetical protein [Vibrio parahaemolyticus]